MNGSIDWKKAPADQTVCWCKGVDKQSIVRAIAAGAETVSDIGEMTGAGRGSDCASMNPTGKCCHDDIQALIQAFLPAFKAMRGGCGCGGNCGGNC